MPSLADLPIEVLLDTFLPRLSVRDLLSLGATCRRFYSLINDDTFWRLKCEEDFNFNGKRTARTNGWKFIYKGLSKPATYVWGNSDNGRLGLERVPKVSSGKVPYPVRLDIPGERIVDIIAGGWSLHALDSLGRVFVTGTLNGETMSLRMDGFSVSYKVASTPHRLVLPQPIKAITCGRMYSMALDASGGIWTFISWGRPYRLITPSFDRSSPDASPKQLECGWMFSSALMASGDVYVWWPLGQAMFEIHSQKMAEMDLEGGKTAQPTRDNAIPCECWDMQYNPRRLPGIPTDLPALSHGGGEEEEKGETKIEKIAAMDGFLIGLTNKGHVLKFGDLSNESSLEQGHWEYLPNFSEAENVRRHKAFASTTEDDGNLKPPSDLKITHISAHFEHFVAYSTGSNSIVLRGSTDTKAGSDAEIIPALQYKSVISVVLGDYHSGALTADGKLLTWGAFSLGALGLGDPKDVEAGAPGGYATQELRKRAQLGQRSRVPDVEVPAEVRFDHGEKKRREKFVFGVAAAGWHMAALVIDLEPEDESPDAENDNEEEPTRNMPGHFSDLNPEEDQDPNIPIPTMHYGPGQVPLMPTFGRGGMGPFRIGFAGRGAARGRGNFGFAGRSQEQPEGGGSS